MLDIRTRTEGYYERLGASRSLGFRLTREDLGLSSSLAEDTARACVDPRHAGMLLHDVCRAHGRIRMHIRAAVFVTILMAALAAAAPAAGQAPCDPTQTPPQFRGEVPTLADVVPFPGGEGAR